MNRNLFAILALVALGLSVTLAAQAPEQAPAGPPHPEVAAFTVVHLYVHSNEPLAAYQLEFTAHHARIVGIEGGEHSAFAEPPYYDPRAMMTERAILAAFSTNPAEQLPAAGKTRVATLHLETSAPAIGAQPPNYELRLITAGNVKGKPIPADASFSEGAPR